jgi:SWI/SNF-related matrix-associated actin-dependent regulator of chromatin subfamily A-like protein 1
MTPLPVPTTFPPSADVRAEAVGRAQRMARGLFTHQVEGVAFLLGRRRAILADDMGLGKTRQSIVALTEAAPVGPWLVVSPASVKQNWAREIGIARPSDTVHIIGPAAPPTDEYAGWVIVNYDILSRHQDALEALPWTGLVFDEAHYLKNHTSQRSKVGRALVAEVPDAVLHALTGTPLTNRPRDLFPLLQLVGHPMGKSFVSFAKRYCAAYHNGYGWVADGASNLEELRIQLHGVMLRRTKDEVLDLPPKLRQWVPTTVPHGTARAEMRAVLEMLMEGSRAKKQAREQVAAGEAPAKSTAGQDRIRLLGLLARVRSKLAAAKVGTTIEFLDGVVAQGEKVIVYSSFSEPTHRIAEHFGTQAVMLTGETPSHERQALVDRFQTDDGVRVFVANLIAGGVGLNLTAARQVVFNDLDWVPANHWQAEDRAYRIGQHGTVNVTYFCATDTVDEFVSKTLAAKGAVIDAVVEGSADAVIDSDLLSDLESLIGSLSPSIATLGGPTEDPVDRLLREVARAAEAKYSTEASRVVRDRVATLPADAVLALARVLSGPTLERYRAVSASHPGSFYLLDVAGGDVTCSCPGFEYRGACTHARALKAALATGSALPNGIERWAGG